MPDDGPAAVVGGGLPGGEAVQRDVGVVGDRRACGSGAHDGARLDGPEPGDDGGDDLVDGGVGGAQQEYPPPGTGEVDRGPLDDGGGARPGGPPHEPETGGAARAVGRGLLRREADGMGHGLVGHAREVLAGEIGGEVDRPRAPIRRR